MPLLRQYHYTAIQHKVACNEADTTRMRRVKQEDSNPLQPNEAQLLRNDPRAASDEEHEQAHADASRCPRDQLHACRGAALADAPAKREPRAATLRAATRRAATRRAATRRALHVGRFVLCGQLCSA